ncbi:MAG: 30S ribosomal protein S14 [Candidatus Marinimicrobia bacterium]|nr:30S ribosomal protein S14 [Candidatus Neomarinimicrobiota bacterium]|tara:strand:- start:9040 stop:9345 length:306 start_codon:yes stop_codon:yes gene_type:complete
MAKKSKIVREKKILRNIQKYAKKRAELKAIINNPGTTIEDRDIAVNKLDRLPKSSSPIRLRNRCFITGRPRGIITRFKLSRLSFREMALNGEIPGVTKASW